MTFFNFFLFLSSFALFDYTWQLFTHIIYRASNLFNKATKRIPVPCNVFIRGE